MISCFKEKKGFYCWVFNYCLLIYKINIVSNTYYNDAGIRTQLKANNLPFWAQNTVDSELYEVTEPKDFPEVKNSKPLRDILLYPYLIERLNTFWRVPDNVGPIKFDYGFLWDLELLWGNGQFFGIISNTHRIVIVIYFRKSQEKGPQPIPFERGRADILT